MTVYLLVFGTPLLLCFVAYMLWQGLGNRKSMQKITYATNSGLSEPTSLHPYIDPSKCLGCGACVAACPEGEVLGLVKRKAELVAPTSCVGHGACKDSCPTHAIELVFGTEDKGVEIPVLTPEFETSVPGIYIAGELGGMGLIRNAISQGTQAIDALSRKRGKSSSSRIYDVVIVGGGPTGLASALAAKAKKLNYLVLEQDKVGGTIAHFPRGKIIMTQPAKLPLAGTFQFTEASKEKLMGYWKKVVERYQLKIKSGARVEMVTPIQGGFLVQSTKGEFKSRTILLAMGRRGTPRKLGVRGEQLSKVVYRLTDPAQYRNQDVLVVGGGDSAIEAALAISAEPNTVVTLSYRSKAFSRAKPQNRERVEQAVEQEKLEVLFESTVTEITHGKVTLETRSGLVDIANDSVIVCAGGLLPTPFLRKVGIKVEEKFGTP